MGIAQRASPLGRQESDGEKNSADALARAIGRIV